MIAWLSAHWMEVVIAGLAIDRALLKILPASPILNKIASVLSSVAPKDQA